MIITKTNEKPPVLAVVGATASGKTALGVMLAEYYGGEVVSADSMQIYEGLDIATAKPTTEEMRGIPHHLMSILPPDMPFSVADYVTRAEQVIEDILSRGKLPIVVGGTGLYVDSLLDHIQFPDIPAAPEIRARLESEAETLGRTALLERLRACDPETASRLHENNLRRIIRALEVYEITGITLTQHAVNSRAIPSPWRVTRIGIGFENRELQYERIRQRVDLMLEQGLIEEVRAEYALGRRRETAAAAIGYKELLPYLNGDLPLADCVATIKQETCRYAKRQGTWFRRNKQTIWFRRDNIRDNAEIFTKCQKMIETDGVL